MFIQLDYASVVLEAIKDNRITLHLLLLEKANLMMAFDLNNNLAKNALSILIKINPFLASLCVKLGRVLNNPEYSFSMHPQLFYSLMNNKLIYNTVPRLPDHLLLQNSSEMRKFLIASFTPNLFGYTNAAWEEILYQFQNIDPSSMSIAAFLIKKTEFSLINDERIDYSKDRFEDNYREEKEFYK